MVEKHRQQLSQAVSVPHPDYNSEAILGETLAVISYNWLAERAAQEHVGDQIAQVTTQYHHGLGITAQSVIQSTNFAGPYVDLPMNFFTLGQQTCSSASCPVSNASLQAFFSGSNISSSLESAVLEQTQAKVSLVAASTVRLLDMNIASGPSNGMTFFADGTTAAGQAAYSSYIEPNLAPNGYSSLDIASIHNAVLSTNKNQQVILPIQGNILVGQHWVGAGYTVITYNTDTQGNITGIGIVQKISGGLSGGFSGTVDAVPAEITDEYVIANWQSDQLQLLQDEYAASHFVSNERVDAIAGGYIYKNTDLITGAGSFPYALPFGRTYTSGSNTADVGMGNGWTHSYSLSASINSDPYQGLGSNSPISAAGAIAAIYVIQDLLMPTLNVANSTNAQRTAVAAIVTRWLTDQLTNNIVTVTLPDTTEQYVWLPHQDGAATITYNPPPGSSVVLTASGSNYKYARKDGTTLTFRPATGSATSSAISSWTWPNGMNVNFKYDGNGNLTRVANNLGRSLALSYTGTGPNQHVNTVTDDTGRSVAYGYDSNNNLSSSIDPLGFTTTFTYDGSSRIAQIFYPSHSGTPFVTNIYDGLGRVAQQANANGAISLFYIAGSRSELIDAAGDRDVTYQTPIGSVTKDAWVLSPTFGNVYNDTLQYYGMVNVATNQYDGLNRLTKATAPEGGVTQYTYSPDLLNNVIQVIRTAKPGSPLAQLSTSYTYDPIFNKPTSVTDPLGLVTTMSYDPITGNLLSTVADAGAAPHFNARTSFLYNSIGQVLSTTDSLGTVTQYGYDSRGNPTWIARDAGPSGLSQTTSMTYSLLGDVTSVTDPNGNVTTRTYDAKRQLLTTTSPGTNGAPTGVITTLGYDPDGRMLTTKQSANGTVLRTTSTTYTLTGQPATATDANGNVTTYAYDVADRLASTTDPTGRVTTYSYDAMSRRIAVSNPAISPNPLLAQTYTPDGLPASLKDANQNATNFAYDGFDRLATTTYPLGSTEAFTYDADGNVLTAKTRANQTITFTYDTLNRLSTKAPPSPAPVVTYSYDLAGRRTGVSDTSAAITPAMPPSPNALATSYTYDAMNRPTTASFTSGITLTQPATTSVAFNHTYNGANQRVGQSASDNTWLNYPAAAPTVTYTANALNQYTAVGSVSPTYDGNGNLTFDGTFTYGYDAENRLTGVTQGGNSVASYAFDAQGRRKSKTVGSTTTIFVTDADNREVLEYDGTSGQVARWYAYGLGPNDVLGQQNLAAGTRTTLIPDIQGSFIGTLDSGGTLTKFAYLPYGRANGTPSTFGYTGQRFDAAENTGLYYYRARMYMPAWGRFLQPDTVGRQGSAGNLYSYVINDPLNATDPNGECPWCIAAVVNGLVNVGIGYALSGGNYNIKQAGIDFLVGAAFGGGISRLGSLGLAARSAVSKGIEGAELGIAELESRGVTGIQTEVTFQEAGGPTRARFDAVGTLPNGNLGVVEFKNGPGAVLNANQTIVSESLTSGGAIPRGGNALQAGLTPGQPLGPTSFEALQFNANGFAPSLGETLAPSTAFDLGYQQGAPSESAPSGSQGTPGIQK